MPKILNSPTGVLIEDGPYLEVVNLKDLGNPILEPPDIRDSDAPFGPHIITITIENGEIVQMIEQKNKSKRHIDHISYVENDELVMLNPKKWKDVSTL